MAVSAALAVVEGLPTGQNLAPSMKNARTARVILDDARAGRERLQSYAAPRAVIVANAPEDVPGALAEIQRAIDNGKHVAGYFSYELSYALEPRLLRRWRGEHPLLWFGVFDTAEVIEGEAVVPALREQARGRAYASPLVHEWNRDEYRTRFATAREFIAAGDIYQVNLSIRSRFAFLGDPLALYLRLRGNSRAAHGAYVDDGRRTILSLSPELFFDLAGDGRITARPMKGTAPRGSDSAADKHAQTALAESAKDRAENLMIVDLLRNDLSRVAEPGSVAVPSLFTVETYPTLHQMVSTVVAKVRPGTQVQDFVRALFPCGSITGAPKIRAMEVIRDLETSPRGVYCGAIGTFSPDGTARFNVAIRTATIEEGRGALGIGSAIVYDSSADAEYDECLLKAGYFDSVREPILLIETLAWRPPFGFERLPLHLARMERSAGALGIPFDHAAARRALDACVTGDDGSRRVRLTLDEEGEFASTSSSLARSPESWTYAISPVRVSSADILARHKTSWREILDGEQARAAECCRTDEVIFLNEKNEVVEGSRTNVFVARAGRLVTPPLDAGALDGCLRRELIESGKCVEHNLTLRDLEEGEVYLGNSLRGLIPAVPVNEPAAAG
jgi:para-aminobenzoate synthetase/4-amino-4-deoxychorismate lyase